VIGGGLPLAAVGGRAEIMDELAPLGPVYQAGTLSGNPLATAAGLAVLAQLDEARYDTLERSAERFADGLRKVCADAGVAAQITRAFTLVGLFFADAPVQNYDDAKAADHERYARLFHGLLDHGVFVAPSGYETMFPSLAHTDANIDATLAAFAAAMRR
jgi:glutamate-1-semialdehyde 2,1-aminomutase